MADITAEAVKELRDRTGAGFMDCKRALEETGGDIEAAAQLLRDRSTSMAAKKEGREAREGLVASYIHTGGKVGVLVEVGAGNQRRQDGFDVRLLGETGSHQRTSSFPRVSWPTAARSAQAL